MFKRFLLCVIVLQLCMFLDANSSECPPYTRCIKLKNCPFYLDNYEHVEDFPYCRRNQRVTRVCCPKPESSYLSAKDEAKRIVQECKSYQSITRGKHCGNPLIVGGERVKPKEYPFMALVFNKNGSETIWLCGGTLISSKFVLTAAHCYYGTTEPNAVRLGELDYDTIQDDATPIDFDIKNYTLHPKYDYETNFNDIALIELTFEVQFSDYIMPACLPLLDGGNNYSQYTAAGWGLTNMLGMPSSHMLKVKLDHFNDATCLAKVNRGTENKINTTIQMCAGSFDSGRDTCKGDSGGPLFIEHPEYKCMYLVFGITSYGEGGCNNTNYPAFYTRVASFIDWIESKVWA